MEIEDFSNERLEAFSAIKMYSRTLVAKYNEEDLKNWALNTFEFYTKILEPSQITFFFNYLNKAHGLLKDENLEAEKGR